MTDVILSVLFLVLSAALFWWSWRLWKRWRNTRRSSILADVHPSDYNLVSPTWYIQSRAPRSKRWPKFAGIRKVDEARAYGRMAKSRSETYLIAGEFMVAFGGALLGSVAFDVLSQGAEAAVGKQVAMVLAVLLTLSGIFLARVFNKIWMAYADGYMAVARRGGIRKRRPLPSKRRVVVAGCRRSSRPGV
ncbi:hypothetical protein [Saccharopolyspora antimicrobica]|uniref:hypothetical protein n=1 Tax=Saccharopolyspora antimicrobica TaxID=455193 RepID=UPI0011603290|nr:hypothetical protein [Saccharopolyspora antimicrobica]